MTRFTASIERWSLRPPLFNVGLSRVTDRAFHTSLRQTAFIWTVPIPYTLYHAESYMIQRERGLVGTGTSLLQRMCSRFNLLSFSPTLHLQYNTLFVSEHQHTLQYTQTRASRTRGSSPTQTVHSIDRMKSAPLNASGCRSLQGLGWLVWEVSATQTIKWPPSNSIVLYYYFYPWCLVH